LVRALRLGNADIGQAGSAYKGKQVAVVTVYLNGEQQQDKAKAFIAKFPSLDFYKILR